MINNEEQRISIPFSEYRTYELYRQLCSFGYMDIQATADKLDAYNIDYSNFAQYVEDFCTDCDIMLQDSDICAFAYEYILNEARQKIEEATGKDIVNDFGIYVYGNFMCSTFDKYETTKDFMEWQFKKKKLDKEDEFLKLFFEDIGGNMDIFIDKRRKKS